MKVRFSITLVLFNETTSIKWVFGEKYSIKQSTIHKVKDSILSNDSKYVLFWNAEHPIPTEKILHDVISSKGDLWHIGSKIGFAESLPLLDSIQPANMLHVKVDYNIDHTSWKISFDGCLMKKSVLNSIPLQEQSKSLDVLALNFGYKAMQSGVLTRYSSLLAQEIEPCIRTKIKAKDEIVFIRNNFDKKAFIWSYLTNFSRISALRFFKEFIRKIDKLESVYEQSIDEIQLSENDCSVSIVIATLERYECLRDELKELKGLNLPAKEIIIVDQTPKENRDQSFLNDFKELPIKYLQTDKIGQCSARNMGIKNATSTFVWFLDDDMQDIPSNYLEKHLKTIYALNADVSCGIPDEIGTEYIDRSIPKVELSEGFPTNDVLVKRKLLLTVGGFDEKMDQMQSEDQEIGLRCIKSGALSVKNNQLRIIHLRAARGGLRNHNVRKITFSSSRKNVRERRLLHHSEIYLNLKHFSQEQVKKLIILNIRGTFIIRGGILKKLLKFGFALLYLPNTIVVLKKKYILANKLIEKK
ncbi:glycosyltransferase family 2 protein [Flavicella marina]|uniref:glycosyltransferase family 2 protein n=1 Tax=Flavicella marina TaxID=1475951 RepID=UPI001264F9B0|nr:glycosyltransferase family 2 protein [Flavicella marina]